MSGFGSTRSVRFSPEGSHAAGGQNGPDHRCDWVASSEEVELRGGGGAVGDERAALSRLRDAYEAHGAEGIVDRRRGRASGRRAGVDEIAWVVEEFRTRYFDF